MEIEELDYVLVPVGMLVLLMYHVWLLYTIIRQPSSTVIGLNAQTRYQWILFMMSVSNLSLLLLAYICLLICCDVFRYLARSRSQHISSIRWIETRSRLSDLDSTSTIVMTV